jgi:hypothetical protein
LADKRPTPLPSSTQSRFCLTAPVARLTTRAFLRVAWKPTIQVSFLAEQEENPAKTDELSEKIDNLEGKLGPEFITLVHALTDIDAHSEFSGAGFDQVCESLPAAL